MDRFDNMRVFARVVESGSFAGAAARLGISASMVTLHIKELEERLGACLLHPTTRKIGLTEVGRAYYERCTRLLADLEETERAVSDLQAAPRGGLRVNANPTFGSSQLAPAISDFLARFHEISIELVLSDRIVDMVEEGFDVAVRAEPLPDSTLIARRLAAYRLVICGAPSYLSEYGTPRRPADLAHHNCLTLTIGHPLHTWPLTAAEGTAPHVSPAGNLRSNSPAVLLCAALAGRGLALTTSYSVGEWLRSGGLVTVLDAYMPPPLMLRVVYPYNRHLSAKVRVFVDFLVERFGREPPWDFWPGRQCGITGSGRERSEVGAKAVIRPKPVEPPTKF